MDRTEWLKSRRLWIGGSDASAIVGMNPWKTNIEVWQEKTGRTAAEDISHKPFVQYGIQAEEYLINLFKLDYPQYQITTRPYHYIKHPDYDFIGGTLDGELMEIETGRKGVLEIKTTNILQSMQREKWIEKIPDNYYIQVIHYLLVTGWDFAILKAQLKTEYGNEVRLNTRHYTIERSDVEDDIQYLLEKELRFWKYVTEDKKPPLTLPAI